MQGNLITCNIHLHFYAQYDSYRASYLETQYCSIKKKIPIPNFIKFLLGLAADTGVLTDRQVVLVST